MYFYVLEILLSGGVIVRGVFVLGGNCLGGNYPGVIVWGVIVRGVIVLEPSSEHLNYKKHSMVRAVYRFHVYYHVRRILKRLQFLLPHESNVRAADNPYTNKEFFKICEDYGVPNDPMKYRAEKFY